MTFGVQTYDSKGENTLNIVDRLTRLLFYHETTTNENDSIVLDDASEGEIFILIHSGDGDSKHIVTRTGNTFEWDRNAYAKANSIDVISSIGIFLFT